MIPRLALQQSPSESPIQSHAPSNAPVKTKLVVKMMLHQKLDIVGCTDVPTKLKGHKALMLKHTEMNSATFYGLIAIWFHACSSATDQGSCDALSLSLSLSAFALSRTVSSSASWLISPQTSGSRRFSTVLCETVCQHVPGRTPTRLQSSSEDALSNNGHIDGCAFIIQCTTRTQ